MSLFSWVLFELEKLVYSPDLNPGKDYTCKELKEIIRTSGQMMSDLLDGSLLFEKGIHIVNILDYRYTHTKDVDSVFPLAAGFLNSASYRDFIGRDVKEPLSCEQISAEDVELLKRTYPELFLENPPEIYKRVMEIIRHSS